MEVDQKPLTSPTPLTAPPPVTRWTRFEELPELLTIPEVQEFFDVSRSTVYDWIRTGTLRAVHMPRIFVPRSALIELSSRDDRR